MIRFKHVALIVLLCASDVACLSAFEEARDISVDKIKVLPPAAERWALLICVGVYDDPSIQKLDGALHDCHNLQLALRHVGVDGAHIIVLATDEPQMMWPTMAHIRRELARLREAKPGLLILALAGHGIERGVRTFFLPYDVQAASFELLAKTAIELREFREEIRRTGSQQVILLVDACRSDGSARELSGLTQAMYRDLDFRRTTSRDIGLRVPRAFVIFFACSPGQRSFECPEGGTQEVDGCFTSSVVAALNGAAAKQSGPLTLARLIGFVEKNVPERVRQFLGGDLQHPVAIVSGYETESVVISGGPEPPPLVSSRPNTPAHLGALVGPPVLEEPPLIGPLISPIAALPNCLVGVHPVPPRPSGHFDPGITWGPGGISRQDLLQLVRKARRDPKD